MAECLARIVERCGGQIGAPGASDICLVLKAGTPVGKEGYALALQPGLGECIVSFPPEQVPCVCLPVRSEACLAVILGLIAPLLSLLTGRQCRDTQRTLPISGKISVSAGISNAVLLSEGEGSWIVQGAGDLALSAFCIANAFAILGPDCEGLPPGSLLTAELLPL
jgi:molybdopterin biosynthesis enzyme